MHARDLTGSSACPYTYAMTFLIRTKRLVYLVAVEPRVLWVTMAFPLVAFIGAWSALSPAERSVRAAGYATTLGGVALVIYGIREKRMAFGRPSLLHRVRGWWGRVRVALGHRTVVIAAGAGAIGVASGSASAYQTATAGAGANLLERIVALERNVGLTAERITGVERQVERRAAELHAATDAEAQERAAAIERLRATFESVAAGGVDLELSGAMWVLLGSAMTTFPVEIARQLAKVL
jgi:hypothetical protein